MAGVIDFGMEKTELKQLLAKSKTEPVNCAMGKGKEASVTYLRLNKIKMPRKIEGELSKDFPDIKDARWGTAFVDTDLNPKLVLFRINRPASGLAKRLVKVVKLAGYSKVRFEFDDGSEAEDVEDEDAEGLEALAEADAPPPHADTLKPRLLALVQRIPQALQLDPSRKVSLLELAKHGQTLMAANDFAGTLQAIEDLEIAIEAPVVAREAVSANTGAVTYAKSRLAWLAVRKQMQSDIAKLRGELLKNYKDTPLLGEIQASYDDRVGKRLETLDESLADLLDDAGNASDPQKRAEKAQAARDKISEYQGFMQKESKLFDDLDSNPFVPLAIMTTLTKTLSTLSAAVR